MKAVSKKPQIARGSSVDDQLTNALDPNKCPWVCFLVFEQVGIKEPLSCFRVASQAMSFVNRRSCNIMILAQPRQDLPLLFLSLILADASLVGYAYLFRLPACFPEVSRYFPRSAIQDG